MKTNSLNKKFDKIRFLEENNKLVSKDQNRLLNKFLNNKLAVLGLILFTIIILATIFAPLLSPYDPLKVDLRSMRQPPSLDHWFGTDNTGRDVFSRVLYGGRVSIFVGLGSSLMAALIGLAIGCYGGYRGGWVDVIALRISEIFTSFPQIILVLLLVSITGQSLTNLFVIFILTGWGGMYRLSRARMLSLREEEYVQALESFGISTFKICYKHMLPNALGPVMVMITLSTAMFILTEAGLSFLGLGVQEPMCSWGSLIKEGAEIMEEAPWLLLFPGVLFAMTLFSLNFLGDGLRDALDPRASKD